MQKIVFCVLSVLCVVALAQFPQSGTLSVTPIPTGGNITDQLGVTNNYNTSLYVKLYSMYIPENALSVAYEFTNLDAPNCGYLNFFMRTRGLPCSTRYYDQYTYLCSNPYNPDNGIYGTYEETAYGGFSYGSDYLFGWEVGTTWYLGVGRYATAQGASTTCPYRIKLTVETCPADQTGVSVGGNPTCVPVVNAVTGNYSVSGDSANPNVFKLDLPLGVGQIQITMASSSANNVLYGRNYGTTAQFGDYNCITNSYDSTSNNLYYYSMTCYTPRAGSFYVSVTDSGAFTGSISFLPVVCPTGKAGYNCSFSVTNIPSPLPYSVDVYVPNTPGYLSNVFSYFYYDIPSNYSSTGTVTISATSPAGSGSGYITIRRDGFPESDSTWGTDSSLEREPVPTTFTLNNFDFQISGRIYIGLSCNTGDGCNFTLTVNDTAPAPLTTSEITTGIVMTTGVMTTGSVATTGAAATTGAVVTTGAAATTGAASTTLGVTTSRVTSGQGLTTSRSLTTSQEDSGVSAVLPTILLALIAIFVSLA